LEPDPLPNVWIRILIRPKKVQIQTDLDWIRILIHNTWSNVLEPQKMLVLLDRVEITMESHDKISNIAKSFFFS
jgi:hypothetical protein